MTNEELKRDAARYWRLRVLGCAPCETKQLENGTVLRFSNLDEFIDHDIKIRPSRGEAEIYENKTEGAAVSASPQREIQSAKNVLLERFAKTFDQVDFHEMAAEIRAEIVPLDSSIFAAAPAQEPDCKDCGDSEEAIIHHLDEDDEVGHKFNPAHSAAQEQPVENSPQKGKP